jgi:hypothetical protein
MTKRRLLDYLRLTLGNRSTLDRMVEVNKAACLTTTCEHSVSRPIYTYTPLVLLT